MINKKCFRKRMQSGKNKEEGLIGRHSQRKVGKETGSGKD